MARTSAVIKAAQAGQAYEHVERLGMRAFHLDDVMNEARQALAAARREADALLHAARREADTLRRRAQDEGYRAGFEQGRTEGREVGRREAFEAASKQFAERQDSLAAAYASAIEQIQADRDAWLASARQDLIELAMAIADRVVHCVGRREREAVRANLDEAIRLVGKRSEVTVRVHPADAETARAFAADVVRRQGRCEHVRVIEDEAIAPGGCRVFWGEGTIDGTLEAQLDRIASALGGSRRERAAKTSGDAKARKRRAKSDDDPTPS